jgi:hypothetical protein
MKFISLEKFINIFEEDANQNISEFLKKTNVRVGRNLTPLKKYASEKNISIEDLKKIQNHIINRREYLTRFYNTSLNVSTLKITDSAMPIKNMNNNQHVHYKNVIRNMFYKEILQKTKSGIENNPSFLDVLVDLYVNNIIDYKILTPSALFYINEGRIGSVFSSFYFRASIMNPYLVYSLNHALLKGSKIFTPTLGWASYCYGFLECPHVTEYVGTDVISAVCKKTQTFANTYYPDKKTTIYSEPSENLAKDSNFRKKYKNYFDVVFFSPPYYRLELYPGGNQSTNQYTTYEMWLSEYWEKTIELCYYVLAPGGKLCYILSGYGSANTKNQYDLIGDMNKITKDKFVNNPRMLNMYNKDVHVTKHRETNEQIIIYHK